MDEYGVAIKNNKNKEVGERRKLSDGWYVCPCCNRKQTEVIILKTKLPHNIGTGNNQNDYEITMTMCPKSHQLLSMNIETISQGVSLYNTHEGSSGSGD